MAFTKKVGKAKAFTAPTAPKKVFGAKGASRKLKAGGGTPGPASSPSPSKGIDIHKGHV